MTLNTTRREFIRTLGLGAASLPFVLNLPSLGFANQTRRKQRLVILFSPNGVPPAAFWPDEKGDKFKFKEGSPATRSIQGSVADPAGGRRQGAWRRRQPHALVSAAC